MPTEPLDPVRLQRFLDDLARLSARYRIALQGDLSAVPAPEDFCGYVADPTGAGVSPWSVGAPPSATGAVVSVDVSPGGVERRTREWHEENAEAIAAHNRAVEGPDGFGPAFLRLFGSVPADVELGLDDPSPGPRERP